MTRRSLSFLVALIAGLSFSAVSLAASSTSKKTTASKPAPQPAPKPAPKPAPVVVKPVLSPREQVYQGVGLTSLFVRDGALTPEAAGVRAALLNAGRHGLNAADYWTPALEAKFANFDPATADTFEIEVFEAMKKYATELSTGRLKDPQSLGDDVKVSRRSLDLARLVAALKDPSPDKTAAFDAQLAPQWPQYARLQQVYAKLSSSAAAEIFPEVSYPKRKNALKLGDSEPMLVNVKTRLRTLGYSVAETGPVYTQQLRDLVKAYIGDHALPGPTDLSRDSQLWSHLGTPLSKRLSQLTLTMEKLRWIQNRPDERYVFVNIALQRFRLWERDQLVMTFKTVNGRPTRKTPTLRDRIVEVELNPMWTVPDSLVLKDKAPTILKDPGFLERGNYIVLDTRSGETLDSNWIDWAGLTPSNVGQIMIKQQAGLGNALGIMKFHLTNPYAIYLHDTNERNLFGQTHRLLSSGCVRLEKPFDLAHYVLRNDPKWSREGAIEDAVSKDSLAGWDVHTQLEIPLRESLPVYLMYLTADVEESTGVIRFATDFYDQDTRLEAALLSRAR